MIYIIVNESGEYSDYNKDILFATSNLERAEKMINVLKTRAELAIKLNQEYYSLTSTHYNNNVPSSNNWKAREDFLKKYNDYCYKAKKIVSDKYNLKEEDWPDQYEKLSIEDVPEI